MNLSERIADLRNTEPRIRARDLAARLAVSEMEVVASRVGSGVTRLVSDWDRLFAALPSLGDIMALTRNEGVVHERRGTYGALEGAGPVRTVLGPDIDLRVFLMHWSSAWAVDEGERRSIQVFDASGAAVHKVYVDQRGNLAAFEGLVASLASETPTPVPAQKAAHAEERPDAEIDVEGFRAAWRALTDTHGFVGLLRTFGVARSQAMRLAPPEMVEHLGVSALATVLTTASSSETPIMVFVGNPGCIQIHSGPVRRIVPTEGWLNVLDPTFNLHVRVDRITACWRVRKPTSDGIVTSLEVYDPDGELAVQLFGIRKPGKPQSPAWESLIDGVGTAA